ncbi:hypothetical protein Tco_0151258 [Tanacetum coccineum]
MPPEDDVLPAEEQPLPAVVSPTTDSPGYITDFDPEEDPKEDLADYPADGGDDDDDDDESSDDDEDDDDDVEEDEDDEEEEEHLAPSDSVPPPLHRILSSLPHILSPPLHVSPPPLPASPTYPLGYRAAMIRLRAESPSTSYPLPLPSPIVLLHTRASVAIMKAVAPSTYILASRSEIPPSGTPPLLRIPLPTPLPHLLLPSTDCIAGVSEVTLPPQKRLCIALGSRFEVSESSFVPIARPTGGFRANYGFFGTLDDEIRRDPEREVGYGITNTLDEMVEDMQGTPAAINVGELSQRMTDFVTMVRQDTNKIYGRLDDAQDDRSLMSVQLNMLRRDRRAHARIARLMETEAILSREAWVQSMDASDTARSKETDTSHRGTDTDEDTADTAMLSSLLSITGNSRLKMAPKRTTRSTPATTTTPTTYVTDEQLKRLINQGIVDALVARDADRSRNGKDSHDSGIGVMKQAPLTRECTYPVMTCPPLRFKGLSFEA